MPQKHFDERLDELKARLLRMSGDIEELVSQAVRLAVGTSEGITPQDIVERDKDIDQAEVEVEELGIELLALHQPMAVDLRVIVTILKINNDLERIGDHAVNIAEAVERLNKSRHMVPRPPELEEMGEISVGMLHDALDAFVRHSAEEALAVGRRDDIVDRLHESLFRVMLTHMTEYHISNCLSVILIGRNIERIADLAVNVAEDAYYMVRGITIRHKGEELDNMPIDGIDAPSDEGSGASSGTPGDTPSDEGAV